MDPPQAQRPRNVAMNDDQKHAPERSDRGRAGQGGKASRRSASPTPRHPRDVESENQPEIRHRETQLKHRQSTDRSNRQPIHGHPGERGKDILNRPSRSSRRRNERKEDRYHPSRSRDIADQPRRNHRGGRQRTRSPSPRRGRGGHLSSPPTKRPRSRSPVSPDWDRKRSRRNDSPRRTSRAPRDARDDEHSDIRAPRHRIPSLDPDDSRTGSRHKRWQDRRRSRSRSSAGDSRRTDRSPPDYPDQTHARARTRSPRPSHRTRSPRPRSPLSKRRQRSPPSPYDGLRPDRPRRRSRSTSRDSLYRAKPGKYTRDEPSSGANSIEVNMAGRGHRGSFGARQQMHNAFSGNPGYNDPRQYSQSPHVTPNPYHSSPNHSPYARNGWSGSPHQHQYPTQYPQAGHGPQNTSQVPYQPSAYSPPPSAPTGPMQQYPRGNGYRSSGAFRGSQFGSGRAGYRSANVKNLTWTLNSQGSSGRGPLSQEDNVRPRSPNSVTSNIPNDKGEEASGDQPNPFRPSKNLQVEDKTPSETIDKKDMAPPDRPPPSGPSTQSTASSKFSFAFKASSKPTPTAPKPEISQKFNAAPPKRDSEPQPDQRLQHPDQRSRDPPHGAPTEPASARARHESRHHPSSGPKPPPAPKTRLVKKKMKRLKPRESLPADLVKSESVYFRKPGNESVVGSGTYGKVFKGLHVYTKRLVALKRIRMEGEKDGFPVTAVREIKLLQSLRHPNIVQLQEVMVERNDCFMVFEYLSHDLTGLLNHPTFKLDAAQKKHLAKQMFEGLDYLHNRGVLHRDLKAANILVSNDGILKLADFGLARFYAKHHQLDYTNRVITIWYRPPELLLGETQYGPACDIWSTGCIMMEFFTRHATFPGDGGEISQLDKIYNVMGTPNKAEWPGLVDMPWFQLLRPGYRRANTFAAKYKDKLTPAAYDLLCSIFKYDPTKRPTAAEALQHAYFQTEDPAPRQAVELATLQGDWHELESKQHRRENERRDREARHAARAKERERKRENDAHDQRGDAKRVHLEGKPGQPVNNVAAKEA